MIVEFCKFCNCILYLHSYSGLCYSCAKELYGKEGDGEGDESSFHRRSLQSTNDIPDDVEHHGSKKDCP